MLALEIEWLAGVCVATRTPADGAPEWPPQPDRVFSALVASWAARGEKSMERAALEWLERLDPPCLEAADVKPRTIVTAYVPPNDAKVTDIRILPERRRRQPRQFPASVILADPGTAHLRIVWEAEPDEEHLAALQALAGETSYVGHSSALVRCRFVISAGRQGTELKPDATRSAPYPGRLAELEVLHRRHVEQADAAARPRPALLAQESGSTEGPDMPESVFGRDWIVFAHAQGQRPDLRAAAVIGRTMRAALMTTYPGPIPEWLSGHTADGKPSLDPHLAVIPLANAGYPWSDGSLMGVALVLPRALETHWAEARTPQDFEDRQAFDQALAALAEADRDGLARLKLGRWGCWEIERQGADLMPTLRPFRYCAASRIWSSLTPIALDRHPKSQGAGRFAEAAAIIAAGCPRIGLPEPARVVAHKHAAVAGAPSAWPAGGSPAWQGWARPNALAHRPLFHATLEFSKPVAGPIILGAGRFFGLGLYLPTGEGAGA